MVRPLWPAFPDSYSNHKAKALLLLITGARPLDELGTGVKMTYIFVLFVVLVQWCSGGYPSCVICVYLGLIFLDSNLDDGM